MSNKGALTGKRDLGLEFYKACMKELRVSMFINNLKKKYNESKKMKVLKESQAQTTFLSISNNEKKV